MTELDARVVEFGRALRAAGIDVHTARLVDVIRSLPLVSLGNRDEVYHTCRTLLVHRREEFAVFDRVFAAFWRAPRPDATPGTQAGTLPREERRPAAAPGAGADTGVDVVEAHATVVRTWSETARLLDKDFAALTPEEIASAQAALAQLAWTPGTKRTRRWRAGRGPRLDLRRTLAHSVRTGGEVLRFARRRRRVRMRHLVLICDVSGSMERYSRMLLQFAHALAARHRSVEAFAFSTQLTRVTPELRARSVNHALGRLARAVPDWSGGTRIGEALQRLTRRHRRALHGDAVVLLVSDGWDRGDPAALRDAIRTLRRRCHRLVWLNPLIGTPDYAPLTRGLQAALPYVDEFLPARTLRDLQDLIRVLNTHVGNG